MIIALRPFAKEGARLSFVSQLNQSSRSRNENGSCDEGQSRCRTYLETVVRVSAAHG